MGDIVRSSSGPSVQRSSKFRRRAGLAVILLLASGIVGAPPLAAQPDWLPEIADSALLSGPTLVEGRAVTESGKPMSGRITVVAWPRQEVLHALEIGDSVKTVPIGKALIARDGNFKVLPDPASPTAALSEDDGTVNFTLYAATDQGLKAFAFTRRHNAVNGSWEDPSNASGVAPRTPSETAVDIATATTIAPAGAAAEAPASAGDKYCESVLRATWPNITTIVGETHPGPDATADFTYVNEATSTLGVGFSATGVIGSWSLSGTSTSSAAGGHNYPVTAVNGHVYHQTGFEYKKFENRCLQPEWETIGFETRSTAWDGGMAYYSAGGSPTANYCGSHAVGSSWKETGTAITFSNAVDISPKIGIDLSAKTGFTTKTKSLWTFVRSGRLCGSNATWPNAARVVGKD